MPTGTSGGPPAFPVLANPIEKRPLKSNIITKSLRLQPLVPENLLPFSQKLLVEN